MGAAAGYAAKLSGVMHKNKNLSNAKVTFSDGLSNSPPITPVTSSDAPPTGPVTSSDAPPTGPAEYEAVKRFSYTVDVRPGWFGSEDDAILYVKKNSLGMKKEQEKVTLSTADKKNHHVSNM